MSDPFRDDREALLARCEALEKEVERLQPKEGRHEEKPAHEPVESKKNEIDVEKRQAELAEQVKRGLGEDTPEDERENRILLSRMKKHAAKERRTRLRRSWKWAGEHPEVLGTVFVGLVGIVLTVVAISGPNHARLFHGTVTSSELPGIEPGVSCQLRADLREDACEVVIRCGTKHAVIYHGTGGCHLRCSGYTKSDVLSYGPRGLEETKCVSTCESGAPDRLSYETRGTPGASMSTTDMEMTVMAGDPGGGGKGVVKIRFQPGCFAERR